MVAKGRGAGAILCAGRLGPRLLIIWVRSSFLAGRRMCISVSRCSRNLKLGPNGYREVLPSYFLIVACQ